jgi:uncharacterized protein
MKIVIIGATGFIGSRILSEAISRGHNVTAIARHTNKLVTNELIKARECDVMNSSELTPLLEGHEAVICSYNPGWSDPEIYSHQKEGFASILKCVKKAGVKRLLVVGGAGSLDVAPGVQFIDTPGFKKEFIDGASSTREFLDVLRKETDLDWTFLCPSIIIEPGSRTERFHVKDDNLIFDENGISRISAEDYAVAMINELEIPMHSHKRFTVGY